MSTEANLHPSLQPDSGPHSIGSVLGYPDGQGFRFWEVLSVVGLGLGLGAIGIYAASTRDMVLTIGILVLVGLAACISGAVLGFLFGVPRLRSISALEPHNPVPFSPNTNLEQISDWLTKVIVGATLVQLGPLVDSVKLAAITIGAQLQAPGGAVAGGAVMVLFFAGGFLWGYLWCSLRIFRELSALIERERISALQQNS